MRVLVVGVDAACSTVLEPLFADDALPTIQSLFADGVSGLLASHVPPWTPSMWPSIYTGVNPGKHGVFSFLSYDGYDWDVVNASHVHEHAIWELLDHLGHSSVVVNVPVTHPPRAFDGALVPGYVAPEPPTCHPAGLLADLEDELGDYRIYADNDNDNEDEDAADGRDGPFEEYRRLTRMRGEAFRYLCGEYDPDFGFLQFQQTDTVFHEHPGEMDLVRDVYRAVDHEIDATLDACDPDTVFVVSDHGIGEYKGYGFAINEFLARHGYVETNRGGPGMPSWVPIRERQLRAGTDAEERDSVGLAGRALSVAGRVGLTTSRVGRVLDRLGILENVAERLPDGLIRAGKRQVDFAESMAYVRGRIELGVRINRQGREPSGVVPPGEFEAVRADLVELLSDVETPEGNAVFEDVAPREEYYEGPYVEGAVDVVTVPADYDHFLTADLLEDLFAEPGQPWNHKPNGIFAVAGAGVDLGTGDGVGTGADGATGPDAPFTANVFDVAPTVLAAMGCPVSDRMDGRVLPVVERTGERSYPTYDGTEKRTPAGDVGDRLEAIGYIDQ